MNCLATVTFDLTREVDVPATFSASCELKTGHHSPHQHGGLGWDDPALVRLDTHEGLTAPSGSR